MTPSFEGNLLSQRHEIWSQETTESQSTLSQGENPKSLSHIGLIWYRDVTPGRIDRRTDRRTDGRAELR